MKYRLAALTILLCMISSIGSRAAFRYVHSQSANPRYPYDTWMTAAHSIHEAAVGAETSDVIVLWPETHTVSGAIRITAGLKQKDDSDNFAQCVVVFDSHNIGRFQTDESVPRVLIRGVTFKDHPSGTGESVLELRTPSGMDATIIDIEYCRFSNNRGQLVPGGNGSAIKATNRQGNMTINILGSLFDGNESAGRGGAVYAAELISAGRLDINIVNTMFKDNRVDDGSSAGRGGAIFAAPALGTLYLTDVRFEQNESRQKGGALNLWGGNLKIDRCFFRGNRIIADQTDQGIAGAAVNVRNFQDGTSVSVWINDSVFDDNYGHPGNWQITFDGGALHFMGSDGDGNGGSYARIDPINITDCVFMNNFAKQGAGAYFGRYTKNIRVDRSAFLHNIAYSSGAAAYKGGKYASNSGETATFKFCLFLGNRAGYTRNLSPGSSVPQGGALMVRRYPRVSLQNCSFLDNQVRTGQEGASFYATDEGATYDADGQSQIVNCCFWSAGGTAQVAARESGGLSAFSAVRHNAWAPGNFNSIHRPQYTIDLIDSPFRSSADAHLIITSPCIDVGTDEIFNDLTTDLDGLAVTDSAGNAIDRGIDIGAYEFSDNDNDYMPDWWEIENGFDPLSGDALADFDADGFSNLREYLSLSDPRDGRDLPAIIADVNSDGDIDGRELALLGQILAVDDCSGEDHCLDLFPDGRINEIDLFLFAEDFGRIAADAP